MQNAGLTVTLSSVPEFQWNGTNPALTNFDCVVHLDGASYGTPMPLAGQTALMNFVNSGKGYVASEWLAYEILQHLTMIDLILVNRNIGANGTVTYNQLGVPHPVLAGIPNSFSFDCAYNIGPAHSFATQPVTVLMKDHYGSDAVMVRNVGLGKVVYFNHAGNYEDNSSFNTLSNTNVQKLYINAAKWASIPSPVITSFTPTTASTGITVTISGSNFTGATAVSFGATAATSFTVVNANTVTAVVGAGASGSVSVTTPGGTASLAGFTYCTLVTPSVTISRNSSGSVCAGTSVTFTAVPVNGGGSPQYQWKKNGNNVGTNSNEYIDAGLLNNDIISCQLTSDATCTTTSTANSNTITMSVLPNFTINATAGANGSISSQGISTFSCDGTGSITYTITPNACWNVAAVTVDGVYQGTNDTYTFSNITANHTINVSFMQAVYFIDVSTLGNGSITSNSNSVPCGGNANFDIIPDPGYIISDVLVDFVSVGTVTSYSFTNVQSPHSIRAIFVQDVFEIDATATAGGSISPPGITQVSSGGSQSYTITADPCFSIADVLVDGVSQGAISTYTFSDLSANHTISASFTQNGPYAITVTAGANGSITPGTGNVNCGDNATYTITPSTCYHILDVIVDGVSQGAITSFTFTDVQADHSISATFAINPPFPVPGPLSGPINVCPYIGMGTQLTYSVPAIQGAASYAWIIPPTCTLVSGQGTNSIVLTVGAGFIGNANKQVRVTALSSCGNSPQVIFYLLAQLPTTPAPIVASTSNVCPSIGTMVSITYTIPKVAAATSYNWAAQAGTTTITHPNGLGVNDTTVTVTFAAGFTTSSITVSATNDCNTSGTRSLLISRNNPATPGLVSGPTNACEFISPGGTPATYTVPNVPGNTYTWAAVPGAIGVAGQGTNSISFTFPNGFTSGSVTVTTTNGCGTSGVRTLPISKLNPATPSVIDVIQTGVCPNRVYTYTLSGTPANSTSVQWTVPGASGAILVSGQGTNSITVSYPSTAVAGSVTAQAVNNCGESVTRASDVKLPACPPEPRTFTRSGIKPTETDVTSLGINVFPNPTTTDFKLQVITAVKETIHVRVMDLQGRVVRKLTLLVGKQIIFGQELPAGIYIAEVSQAGRITTQKLIKW